MSTAVAKTVELEWERWYHAVSRFDGAVREMEAEDAKPIRQRDSSVYARCYAVIETWALFFGIYDDSGDEAEHFDRIRNALMTEVAVASLTTRTPTNDRSRP
jgi:hypothetical protein